MTVTPPESNDQGQTEQTGEVTEGHPAYQEILDALPDSLKPVILPTLKKWDEGVQQKLQSIHSQYDPYKPFVDEEVDPEFIQGALNLAKVLNEDPEAVVKQAIETFGLDYVQKALAGEPVDDPDGVDPDFTNDAGFDITEHPAYKAQQEALSKMQERFDSMDADEQAEAQQEQMETYLKELETKHGEFDRLYVTAMVANGIDGDKAVELYHESVNQAAAKLIEQQGGVLKSPPTPDAPIVAGSAGSSGSGIPNQPVQMGTLKDAQVKDLVLEMLKSAATE